MNPPVILDDLRTTFRLAYERYIQEGWRMREILMDGSEAGESERREAISKQQKRLDEALRNYEEARTAYVNHVLAGFVSSGGAQL